MKKLIITTIFALFFGMGLSAQNDGFFTYNNVEDSRTGSDSWGTLPALPGYGAATDFEAAPLGNGLLLLGGMAMLWLKANDKRRKE